MPKKPKNKYITVICVILAIVLYFSYTSKKSEAAICCVACCSCTSTMHPLDTRLWLADWYAINIYIYTSLLLHQQVWFDQVFWQRYLLPAFMQMGMQLSAVGTEQVMAIGMFIDAKEQMETQRLLQKLHAKANKKYHISVGMCEFGSRVRSLVASERKGEMSSLILSERSLDRFLGNKDTGASGGEKDDIAIRLNAFQETYCDPANNNGGLAYICPNNIASANPDEARKSRFNKDIDYQRTIQDPWTIDFNLTTGGEASEGDEDVIALSNNLYGYNSFNRADYEKLKNTGWKTNELQKAYLDMRAAVAKTKVAENSYNAIVALKAEGTSGSKDFIEAYLRELGVPSTEVEELLGENPSYNAQMEILTKKAYQSPVFYTNLYDKPANVERKGVAIQAISLIQKFDLLKSYLRTEASLSILLELSVDQLQRETEDKIKALGNNL